jgi:hypothetical protein
MKDAGAVSAGLTDILGCADRIDMLSARCAHLRKPRLRLDICLRQTVLTGVRGAPPPFGGRA